MPNAKPVRAPQTSAASVADAVKSVREGAGAEDGEPFAATLDNIDKRTVRATLAGGIASALLVKKTRHAKVRLQLSLHWGDEAGLKNQVAAGDMLGALMQRRTAHKTYAELRDAEDQLEASIGLSTGVAGLTLTIDSVHDQLGPALALASEMMSQPAFVAAELDIVRRERIAALEANLQDPETVANLAFWQTVWPRPAGDPRRTLSTQEDIDAVKKVSLADVQRFYTAFAGASHGELVVVGDFDAAAVSAQIEALSAKWPSKATYARLVSDPPKVAGKSIAIPLPDKENAMVELGHDVALRDGDADYPAMVIANQVLGGGVGARLWMRIREKDGMSYDLGSWLSVGDTGGGEIGVYAITAPQNLAKVEASLTDELRRIATQPIAAAELTRAKEAWLKIQDTALADDGAVASLLARQLYAGRDLAYVKNLRAKIAALTAADVERAAKKYVEPDRVVLVKAYDPAK